MRWELFIDDERFPAKPGPIIARNQQEVEFLVWMLGMPTQISFDHDLGENEPTGYDIAKWLVEKDLDADEGDGFPDDFSFYVHSMNPIGAENIRQYLGTYMQHSRNI